MGTMANFEVLDEKRDMIKVRYKGIGTVGYRYLGDSETPVEDSRAVPDDKDGGSAWAAQFRQAPADKSGVTQERNEKGQFSGGIDYDPAKDTEEPDEFPDEDEDDSITVLESPARRIIRETPFVERVFDPTENISTTTSEIERQQRYNAIPYEEYLKASDLVLDRLENQTREVLDENGEDTGIMWTVRYAVIGESATIVDISHDDLEYDIQVEDITITEDMDKRKTEMAFVEADSIELVLNEIENPDSLQNQFSSVLEAIFNAVQEDSGTDILIFQSVVEGWQYD